MEQHQQATDIQDLIAARQAWLQHLAMGPKKPQELKEFLLFSPEKKSKPRLTPEQHYKACQQLIAREKKTNGKTQRTNR